jgi:anaerobic magnesium-protoporphyrin IX monomethyl ester cyclase
MSLPMKKVLFIIPSYADAVIDKYALPSCVVPFGVLSLASYLEYHCANIECKVLDFNNGVRNIIEQCKTIESQMLEFNPDIVGLSIMYNACQKYLAPFAEIIKRINPHVMLVAGGIMATNMPQEVFGDSPLIDAVCYGEGEIPLKDLISSDNPEATLREHPSWILPDSIKNGKHPTHSFVLNLDDIPPINYSLVDIKQYSGRISNKDGKDKFTLPIHSTRGCPFNCIFCCSAANHGRKVRAMSASRFLSDVAFMVREYGITKLSIDDDQFLFYRDRAKEILIGLAKFNIEVEMANGLTVRFIDDEIALLLKKAGLKIAVLAIESGSPHVLREIIEKPLDLEQVRPAVEALRKQDLSIHTFFIIGFPGETPEDRNLTRELIINTGFDWNGIYIATPYKGSRLFELCSENGYISTGNSVEHSLYQCQITSPGIDPQAITREAYLLNLDVNFVNNYNLSKGLYKKAAQYLSNVAKRYPQHAFAHYFLAKAMEGIPDSNPNSITEHYRNFNDILSSNNEWMNYAIHFNLPVKA